MPNSLLDMFQPQNAAGEPASFGDAFTSRSNSLIGLGLGLLSPSNPLRGQSGWGQALEGFQGGAQIDARTAGAAAQLKQHRADQARAQANADRAFAAGQVTDAQRAMKDVLGPNAAPEQKADFMKNYYASKTDPGGWILKDIIDPQDPEGERKITVQEHNRTGQIRPPQLPGQTGAVGPIGAANPFPAPGADGGGAPPVYGVGGNFSGGSGAAPAVPTAPNRSITLPNGEVLTPPPGLSKKGREAWQNHVATTAADMQSGKMTEAQAKYSIYASGMEIAQRELQGHDATGTAAQGKGLATLPWGVGAYFQSNEYQNYRNAKDAWLNAKLRAESGATINPDEFARDDRIYFPQPGEGPEQVAAKARLREHITKNMTKAGGPGYTSPPPTAPTQGSPTAAPVRVTSPGAARKLPSGTQIILPDGRLGTVP